MEKKERRGRRRDATGRKYGYTAQLGLVRSRKVWEEGALGGGVTRKARPWIRCMYCVREERGREEAVSRSLPQILLVYLQLHLHDKSVYTEKRRRAETGNEAVLISYTHPTR